MVWSKVDEMSKIRNYIRRFRKTRELKKLMSSMTKEMNKLEPFHPIRSVEEVNRQLPYVEEELQKFLVSVNEGRAHVKDYIEELMREMPSILVLPYLFSAEKDEVPSDRAAPYYSYLSRYMDMITKSELQNDRCHVIDVNLKKDLIQIGTSKAYESAQSMVPKDVESEIERIAESADAFGEASQVAKTLRDSTNPFEFAEKISEIVDNLNRNSMARVDHVKLASQYFGLNMADYFYTALFSHIMGSENPYAGLYKLCKDGYNVLNFAEIGDEKKILVECPIHYDGKPVWGVYVQGDGEIMFYNRWRDSVITPARKLNEAVSLPHELTIPLPRVY